MPSLFDFVGVLRDLALQYGYFGVFLASLFGSVVPFLPVPYLFVVILLSNTLNPVTLGIAAGIGGALGKATSYFLGRSGYLVVGNRTKKNLELLGRFIGKYGDLGVFIFAVTPLPDDVYLVPLGMVKFPFWRYIAVSTLGKVILSISVAYFGSAFFQVGQLYFGANELLLTLALVGLTVVITVLLARADWGLAYSRYKSGGGLAVLRGVPEILGLRKRRDSAG